MVNTYKTRAGDTFDSVAFKEYGTSKYLPELLKANPQHLNTFIFGAGVELILPEIKEEAATTSSLPSWFY